MELFDPTSLMGDEAPEDVPTIMAVVSDEYVDQFKPGQCLTVNATIGVDHLPSRDYLRDTRRILRLMCTASKRDFLFTKSNSGPQSIDCLE